MRRLAALAILASACATVAPGTEAPVSNASRPAGAPAPEIAQVTPALLVNRGVTAVQDATR